LHDCNDLFMKKICHLFEEDEAKPTKAKVVAAEAQPQAQE
jgi:hypothetical protein